MKHGFGPRNISYKNAVINGIFKCENMEQVKEVSAKIKYFTLSEKGEI